MAGKIDQTQYLGDIDINLSEGHIEGILRFPRVDLKDISYAFDRIYKFPLDVQGAGTGQLQFAGPLDFWHMSYDLSSQFKNGKIGVDGFNELIAKVTSKQGVVSAKELTLTKGSSKLRSTPKIPRKRGFTFRPPPLIFASRNQNLSLVSARKFTDS